MSITQTISRQNFADNFNFTTFQNDPTMSPFMIAFDIEPGYIPGEEGILNINDFQVSGDVISYNTTLEKYIYSDFNL